MWAAGERGGELLRGWAARVERTGPAREREVGECWAREGGGLGWVFHGSLGWAWVEFGSG